MWHLILFWPPAFSKGLMSANHNFLTKGKKERKFWSFQINYGYPFYRWDEITV